MAFAQPGMGFGTSSSKLPQPIAGQNLNWSQQPGRQWSYATDPNNPQNQIGYDPATGQWDYSNPTLGYGAEQGGQDPRSFQAAQTDFNNIQNSQPNPALLQALAQPAYAPTPTLENPTLASQTQLGFGNVSPELLAALSPQVAENLLVQGFQPQAQQAERNLQQTLANAGIVGGPAVQQEGQLQEGLAAALAPSLAGLVSGSQGNLISAAGGGAGLQQGTTFANQGAANAANERNVGAINATNAGNVATQNASNQNLLNILQTLYGQQAGQYGGTVSTGQQGSNKIAGQGADAYQIPSGNTSGLTGALGQIYQPKTAQTTYAPSTMSDGTQLA